MTAKEEPEFYIVNQDFHMDGEPMRHKGEIFRRGHRLVKAAPLFFDPYYDIDRPDVEQATAAPGEKRGAKP